MSGIHSYNQTGNTVISTIDCAIRVCYSIQRIVFYTYHILYHLFDGRYQQNEYQRYQSGKFTRWRYIWYLLKKNLIFRLHYQGLVDGTCNVYMKSPLPDKQKLQLYIIKKLKKLCPYPLIYFFSGISLMESEYRLNLLYTENLQYLEFRLC